MTASCIAYYPLPRQARSSGYQQKLKASHTQPLLDLSPLAKLANRRPASGPETRRSTAENEAGLWLLPFFPQGHTQWRNFTPPVHPRSETEPGSGAVVSWSECDPVLVLFGCCVCAGKTTGEEIPESGDRDKEVALGRYRHQALGEPGNSFAWYPSPRLTQLSKDENSRDYEDMLGAIILLASFVTDLQATTIPHIVTRHEHSTSTLSARVSASTFSNM